MLIYLIRHGQTDWNRDRKIMGTGPIPLNDEGRRSVGILAAALEKESSDMARDASLCWVR